MSDALSKAVDYWTRVNAEFAVADARRAWAENEVSWGIWRALDAELGILGDVSGLEAVDLGCGTAYFSAWLARRGATVVGVDPTPAQLATARRLQTEFGLDFPLVQASPRMCRCRTRRLTSLIRSTVRRCSPTRTAGSPRRTVSFVSAGGSSSCAVRACTEVASHAPVSLRPRSFTTLWPRGQVKNDELLLMIDYPQDQTPNVDGPTQEFIRRVGQYLEWSRQQIDSFNRILEQEARRAIEARRQRVEQRNAQLAKSSIPLRRPGDKAKTYILDVLVRRPAPSLPETRADDKPPQLEPVLDERSSNTSSASSVCRPGRLSRAPVPTPGWARRIAARRSWRR
jgi:Methyltransferase domain